jgi:hypothetical protein
MAYVKPGVEITQVQRTFSPTLIAPDLVSAIVGPAYMVVQSDGADSYPYAKYSPGTTYTLSGLQSYHKLDGTSVYADLYMSSGVYAGSRLHIEPSTLNISDAATSVTITSGMASAALWSGADVYIGFRALSMDPRLEGFMTIEATDDLDQRFGDGQVVIDNPLPFAVSQAMANTSTTVSAVATFWDDFSSLSISGSSAMVEHDRAIEILESKEVYAIAPLTKDSTIISRYRSNAVSMSLPAEKHERIIFASPSITFEADKATTARTLRDTAVNIAAKRYFNVIPDVTYFKESGRQVQKIKASYINSIYGFTNTEYCILASNYRLASGKTYKAGSVVTDSLYTELSADTTYFKYDVYVPTPGSFMAAAIVGMVSGQLPQQGFTNVSMAGPSMLKYSNDYFTESQLNTIAEGGNYIMVNINGVIFSRHQLSTDMSSIECRELNITKVVDYTAKYIRNTLAGYIGRSLITPGFLQTVGAIINGLGKELMKQGVLNDFKVTSIKQDEVSKDTVRVAIEIKPPYPVNYIKVDLIF